MHALRLAWLNIQQKVCTSDSNIYQPLIKADRIWGKSIGGTNSIVFAVSPSGLYSRAYNWSCFTPKHLESYWSADMMKINYSFSLLGLISNTVACTLLCLSYSSLHWLCVLFHGLSSRRHLKEVTHLNLMFVWHVGHTLGNVHEPNEWWQFRLGLTVVICFTVQPYICFHHCHLQYLATYLC